MTRVKESLQEEASTPPPTSSVEATAVSPEALRKPYSSLAPQRLAPQKPGAESAKPSLPPASKRGESRRWNDTTEARRSAGTCGKHGIARSPSGECMLCKKEETQQRRSPWPLVLGGIGAAALIFYGWLYLL